MSEQPFPLVEVAPQVFVAQIRAAWAGSDGQTHIRVDEHLTLSTSTDVDTVVTNWQEGTR
ncbi:MAG: hypothetical protein ACJ780_31555 [Solirubrobacteraceae bacterium]|jgi:hypothetical protein